MMLLSNKSLLSGLVLLVFIGCLNFGPDDPEPPFITDDESELIKAFAVENGYPESLPVDNFVEYLYDDWPNDDRIIDFILTFPAQDSSPRTLVLSDKLTMIGKSLRVAFHSSRTGRVYPAHIDSIEISTDSVIILPSLVLSWCNLTHLPPEIGKIRTKKLDISWNIGLILPEAITKMDSLPQPYETLDVDFDQTWTAETFDSLPKWAKDWLGKHNL